LGDVSALPRDHDDPNEVYRPCAAIMTALSAKGVTQVACGTVRVPTPDLCIRRRGHGL
jgi:hypothetical protein